jgi:hypothetical protein
MFAQVSLFKSRSSDFGGFSLKPDRSNLAILVSEISSDEMA